MISELHPVTGVLIFLILLAKGPLGIEPRYLLKPLTVFTYNFHYLIVLTVLRKREFCQIYTKYEKLVEHLFLSLIWATALGESALRWVHLAVLGSIPIHAEGTPVSKALSKSRAVHPEGGFLRYSNCRQEYPFVLLRLLQRSTENPKVSIWRSIFNKQLVTAISRDDSAS